MQSSLACADNACFQRALRLPRLAKPRSLREYLSVSNQRAQDLAKSLQSLQSLQSQPRHMDIHGGHICHGVLQTLRGLASDMTFDIFDIRQVAMFWRMNCRDGVHKVMSCHVSLFTLVRPANGWKTLEDAGSRKSCTVCNSTTVCQLTRTSADVPSHGSQGSAKLWIDAVLGSNNSNGKPVMQRRCSGDNLAAQHWQPMRFGIESSSFFRQSNWATKFNYRASECKKIVMGNYSSTHCKKERLLQWMDWVTWRQHTTDLRHSEQIASCPRDLEETPAAPEIDDQRMSKIHINYHNIIIYKIIYSHFTGV